MQGYSRDVNGRCIPREQCPKVTETCASYGKDCQRCLTNGCMMTGESGSCEENWPIADISMYVASSATEASAVCARRAREKERQDGCAAISSCEECKASKYDCMFGSWSTNEAPFCSVGCTGFCPPMVEAKCDAPVTGQCPPGEQFTTCSTMCESTCGDDPFAPCIEMCGPPKCQCMSGYSRDVNGRCIPRRDCLNTITTRPTASSPCRAGGLVNGEGGVQVVTETGSVTSIPRGAIGTGCGVLAGQITIEGSGYVLTTQGGTSISLTVASQKIKTPQGTLR
jgi:hypothetical protein